MSVDGRAYGAWGRRRQPGLPGAKANISAVWMSNSDSDRAARLAAALRENLRRRKAQSRAETQRAETPPADQKKDDTQPASE